MGDHSFEDVSKVLRYDAETGEFFWKVNTSQRTPTGARAGTVCYYGYIVIGINRKYYKAHRLAFLLMTGRWPVGVVDHINCVRADNRFCNLRVTSAALNSRNQGPAKNNTSGFKGVSWHKAKGLWVAQIRVDRKHHSLGYFDTPEKAAEAYDAGSIKYHGEYGRLSTTNKTRTGVPA